VAVVGHASLANASQQASAPDATMQEIAARLDRGDLAGAKAAAAAALHRYPNDPALNNLAGAVSAQGGDFGAAERHFQTAIRLSPRQPAPYENLGRLYQERGPTDPAARAKALDIYRRLLDVDPSNREGLYQAGFLLTLQGRFAESQNFLERLPEDIRARPQILAVLTVDLAGAGTVDAAKAAAARVAAHPELAAADVVALGPAFEQVTNDDPIRQLLEALDRRSLTTPESLLLLGQLHIRHRRYDDARTVLERALTVAPDSVPVLIDLARVVDKSGAHEKALAYLGRARTLAPDNVTVHFLFGIVCVEMDLGGEAYESMKKALALAPDHPGVNYMMGVVSLPRHDPSEAVPYFERYVQLKPDDVRGRLALGVAKFKSNDFEGASAILSKVSDRPEAAAGANYFLARIARQSNNLPEARRRIDLSIAADGKSADAWAELGLLQTRAQEYEAAEASLQKALTLQPENYQATVNLTALYTKTRDPRLAEQNARLQALQQKREQRGQDFIRIVQVVPE
jgi:tetratricopeptide (TPR) repeat protein